MELGELKITKKDLDRIPDNERFFFLQLLNFMNDINVLQKFTIYTDPKTPIEETNSSIQRSQDTVMVCIIFNLIGKLYEGWGIVGKLFYGTGLSKEYSKLLNDVETKNLKYLKRYFETNTLFKEIRNNVSFHYGGDSNHTDKEKLDILKDNYDKFSDDEEMFLYLGGNFGNYISTTQVVTLTSILNHMKSDSDEFSFPDSISSLFGEVTIITGRFQEFIVGCLDKIIGRHFPEKVQLISIPEPPIVNEVFCPFFVRPRTKPTD